jgi:hypothetical protein
MVASNTIFLKGHGQIKEGNAGGAITPGHLLIKNTSDAYVVHATAEGNAYPVFAMEKDFVGKDLSTAYVSGERVQALHAIPGDEVYALVPASALAIVIGDELVSNGDGTLKKVTAGAVAVGNLRRVVATALEAVDNSGGGSPARIRVQVV